MKNSTMSKIVLSALALGIFVSVGMVSASISRKPATASKPTPVVDLNGQFHRLSQLLRTQHEMQAELERELPENIFAQKCNNSKVIDKEVNLLIQASRDQQKSWKSHDFKKVKQLFSSLENMRKISAKLVQDCNTPVPTERLSELRSEVMSAGFLFQNLSNPFEVSENR